MLLVGLGGFVMPAFKVATLLLENNYHGNLFVCQFIQLWLPIESSLHIVKTFCIFLSLFSTVLL